MRRLANNQSGFTLLELLMSLAIAALLMSALTGVVAQVFEVKSDTLDRQSATRDAQFAMQRMVSAVRQSDHLLLPLIDSPITNWRENVREQRIPPAAPEGSSTFATAVLAVTLGPTMDRDEDGWADANNDKDFLDRNNNGSRDAGEPERIDEDLGGDATNDGFAGIVGIDDDGDGAIDESASSVPSTDDDEDDDQAEDSYDGIDNDGDGSIDEDMFHDQNNDGQAGIAGVDDDFDLLVDEGAAADDDEDGLNNEDWRDPIVFYLKNGSLVERLPNLNPADGNDFTEFPIAENVSHFRVERIPVAGRRAILLDITLEVTPPDGEPSSVNTRVRVGGGL